VKRRGRWLRGCLLCRVALVIVTRAGAIALPTLTLSRCRRQHRAGSHHFPNDKSTPSRPVRVLIIGDSVAVTLSDGLERAQPEWNLAVWNQSVLGCGLVGADAKLFQGKWIDQGTECADWRARWQSDVDTFNPDIVLVLSGAWDTYDMNVDGRALEFGTADADHRTLAGLEQAVDVLSSRGATVVLLTTPYPEKRDLAVDGRTNRVDWSR
jgi:hypothetical protein